MTSLLDELAALGVLSPVDVHFARLLGRLSPSEPPEVLLGAALASRAVQRGHVCADLDALSHRPLVDDRDAEAPAITLPDPSALRAALSKSPLVATSVDRAHPRPLVLARNKLYLHRYAAYEAALAECLRRSALVRETVNADALRNGLDRLFGSAAGETDEQRRAALVTVLSRLSIVSGGPGTGKTYTVSRILALLQTLAKAAGRPFLRVLLLAPTGKAAQRVAESIERSVADLDCDDDVRAAIPRKAATIHRALGHRPNTPTRYRHDAENPLPVDVVIVDEASMIDVALMAKLVLAVPPEARLVLLGDKDQLASVEAGAILGDIYGGDAHAGYSEAMRTLALRTSGDVLPAGAERDFGLGDCLVHLTKSRRFGADSDVGALARAIQAGDAGAALSVLSRGGSVRLHPLDAARNLEPMLGELVLEHYGAMREHGPEGRLALLSEFRILCAHRRGGFGVDAVNTFVERHLEAHGRLRLGSEWYDGRPVMIAANDYQLSLWNGDVAVIANTGEDGGAEAHFETEKGHALRKLPPSRLPAHETVFAMTVHKSQGSQFSRIALVLPEKASPILTRELVYTAVSRAEAGVDVFGDESVFAAAIARTVERSSGLREALWGDAPL